MLLVHKCTQFFIFLSAFFLNEEKISTENKFRSQQKKKKMLLLPLEAALPQSQKESNSNNNSVNLVHVDLD